jgi:alkanesulfonate monooxygenase SsuD/methylene tetrahydromethanopterin reductase-like flavin-dependent oxidoreductase (luciferase family)
MEDLDHRIKLGSVIGGTPDECARGAQAYADIGADQLIFGCTMVPFEDAIASTSLFGVEVIPRFDTDPQHRSSRMREAAAHS